MRGADVLIALSHSGPGVIQPEWITAMAKGPDRFCLRQSGAGDLALGGKEAGARIVATGRSDFPNQVNNSLGFPGIFRGTLDVRARTITDEMCFAAAQALADQIGDRLDEDHILPTMDDWEVFPREAAAVAIKAQEQGVARLVKSYEELYHHAHEIIRRSREQTRVMMEEGFIAKAPEN